MANLYQRNGWWYGRVRRGGKEYRESFKTKNRALAEKAYREWLAKIEAGTLGLDEVPLTFDDLAAEFARSHMPHLRPKTIETYQYHIRTLSRHFQGLKVSDITSRVLREYIDLRRDELVKMSTIRQELIVLSGMYSLAIAQEKLTGNAVQDFIRAQRRYGLKQAPPRERYLSEEEERIVLAHIRRPDAWKAIVFAIETGLRAHEQFTLRWSDFRPTKGRYGEIFVREGKGGKSRIVPLTERAAQILAHMPRHPTDPTIFIADKGGNARIQITRHFETVVEELIEKGAIENNPKHPGIHWHDLRRTCGCRLLQRGVPIEKVSMMLGHASIAITQKVYAFLRLEQVHEVIEHLEGDRPVRSAEIVPLVRRGGH